MELEKQSAPIKQAVDFNIFFTSNFSSENAKTIIMSINNDLLEQIENQSKYQHHEAIKVVAHSENDDAVLISHDKSYQLKRCEHSNTFYVLRESAKFLPNPEDMDTDTTIPKSTKKTIYSIESETK